MPKIYSTKICAKSLHLRATFDHCCVAAMFLRPHICLLLNISNEILRSSLYLLEIFS